MKACWCGGEVGQREPGDRDGLGCLENITHVWRWLDPCPDCGTGLRMASGGGVVCPSDDCDYWFCY